MLLLDLTEEVISTLYLDSPRKASSFTTRTADGTDCSRISGLLLWSLPDSGPRWKSRAGSQSFIPASKANNVIGFPPRRSGPVRHLLVLEQFHGGMCRFLLR